MSGKMSLQRQLRGVSGLSREIQQSVPNLKFEIDHVPSFKSHGIKKLKKAPVPPIYESIYGINPYLFHIEDKADNLRPLPALAEF
jgi:hypothetical protein